MAKCKTCYAPVDLAPDGDPRYRGDPALRREVRRLTEALTLIERVYYMEGKDPAWVASHMNGIARDAHNGQSLGWARRLFPRATVSTE